MAKSTPTVPIAPTMVGQLNKQRKELTVTNFNNSIIGSFTVTKKEASMSWTYYSRIVGNKHRLAGSLVLPVLAVDQSLILEPEPENPYDAEAIKVMVDMTGSKYSNIEEGPIVHLGYLPRSGTRTDTTGFGNRDAMRIMQGGVNWAAYLSFSPQGDPLVRIEVWEEAA